jgi:hypothetical protein
MRQTAFRLLASGAMAATLTLGLTATAAGAAVTTRAQPAITHTCHGYACHGHDPVKYHCSVWTTTSTSDHLVTLWNRYSLNCNTNWARAKLSTVALLLGDSMQVLISTTDSKGKFEAMCYPGPSDTGHQEEDCTRTYRGSLPAYTDMVDGTDLTWATVLVYHGNSVVDDISVKQ